MASFNLTNFDAAMKQFYPQKKVQNMVYKNNPWLSMIPKATRFPGRNAQITVEYGVTPGRSATFSTAQSNRGGTQLEDFIVTRVKDYAVVSVDNETLLAADGDEGSLLDVAKNKTDSALRALARSMGQAVYGGGTGAIGVLDQSENATGTTITLTNSGDVVNFEKGYRIVVSLASAEGGALVNNGAAVEITAVDRDAGTLTIATAMELVWGSIGADHSIYIEGDASNNASPGSGNWVRLAGLDAWIPSAAPTSTAFFGVDRTSDATRLGGHRLAGSASIQESLIDLAVRIAREGGMPDCVFVAPAIWANLAKDLEGTAVQGGTANRRRYENDDASAVMGFSSLKLAGPTGMIDIYSDHNCQAGTAWMLQKDTWELRTIGSAPRILDFDGLKGIREQSADGVEYRWGFYGNMICHAPGWNGRLTGLAVL